MITEINGLSVLAMGSESDKWMIGEIEKWLARLASGGWVKNFLNRR
jgi:hypothetical protein